MANCNFFEHPSKAEGVFFGELQLSYGNSVWAVHGENDMAAIYVSAQRNEKGRNLSPMGRIQTGNIHSIGIWKKALSEVSRRSGKASRTD